jgi:hypothetical protein
MTLEEAEKWKEIGKLYEQSQEIYISLYRKIQDNIYSNIVNVSKKALSSGDLPEYFLVDVPNKNKSLSKVLSSGDIPQHAYQIIETTKEIWKKYQKKKEEIKMIVKEWN